MTRGNQRDNDRAKAQKKAQAQVCLHPPDRSTIPMTQRLTISRQKGKNTMSGSQFQKSKEDAAAIMREKQKKADEKKAAEAGGKKK
ncbi:hypothetical protein NUU61_009729 [Penicillium alfredii]|uniref:Small EDRK-rich factor-like N-terminal domain-containing protein n=1 Tax=Penicillium alfredii TaxID=1506179 RepID=A0A9W9JTV6_9EURO|nr:uncharacterized protein NUU61_009729 [Penicillium alfredii]KAJ5081465.1 hypothetical protein NUU61_009729 [Penicillium alfredii]